VYMHVGRYEAAGWGEFWAGVVGGRIAFLHLPEEGSPKPPQADGPPRELLQFARKWGLSITSAKNNSLLDELWQQLGQYLQGERRQFQLPLLLLGTGFQKAVWEKLTTIPWGTTVTYGELAASLGNRGLARAVGQANSLNPVPIIVPCHRVVAVGGLGGYSGGLSMKQRLLQLEGWPLTTMVEGKGG